MERKRRFGFPWLGKVEWPGCVCLGLDGAARAHLKQGHDFDAIPPLC